nr:zinc finger, CCHC-type [Tanacetum cinerariifolium]
MTYHVASLTLDSARSYVMQGAPFTQGTISSLPICANISLEGFLLLILLLVVIIVTVFIVAVILVVVIRVVIAIIGVVVVVGDLVGLFYPNRLAICIPPRQGIIGFLLGLSAFAMVVACASRTAATPSVISYQMAASVIAGVADEANTSYESSCKLVENNGRAVAQIEYASAIGCLMYATHCTRPDIAYAACKLSRYTSNPSQDHWKAIGRVFGYLKRTRQLALYYDRFSAVYEGYSDASWITRSSDRYSDASWITGSSDSKSTTGWIFTLGGGAICWGSKKQTCITHSTIEAEFLALAAVGKEA